MAVVKYLNLFFYLEYLILIPVHVLLMLAGQPSEGAIWIPFYQQLSS